MIYNPDIHHRRSIRLKGYDYSSGGAYFVTICTHGRECLFGRIVDDKMQLNDAGEMIEEWWAKLPGKFPDVVLDSAIVMPNHFHGIIVRVGADPCVCPAFSDPSACPGPDLGQPHGTAPTLGDIMAWFKTMTTNAYIKGVKYSDWPPFSGRLWQRNYYERVIRNDNELFSIREYIMLNPSKWAEDEENPVP